MKEIIICNKSNTLSEIHKSEFEITTGHVQYLADILHIRIMPLNPIVANNPRKRRRINSDEIN